MPTNPGARLMSADRSRGCQRRHLARRTRLDRIEGILALRLTGLPCTKPNLTTSALRGAAATSGSWANTSSGGSNCGSSRGPGFQHCAPSSLMSIRIGDWPCSTGAGIPALAVGVVSSRLIDPTSRAGPEHLELGRQAGDRPRVEATCRCPCGAAVGDGNRRPPGEPPPPAHRAISGRVQGCVRGR